MGFGMSLLGNKDRFGGYGGFGSFGGYGQTGLPEHQRRAAPHHAPAPHRGPSNDKFDEREYLNSKRAYEPQAAPPQAEAEAEAEAEPEAEPADIAPEADAPAAEPEQVSAPQGGIHRWSIDGLEAINNRDLLIREERRMGDGASVFGVKSHEAVPHTSYYDFRDYDPDYYGMSPEEYYADCVFPEDHFKLDTP